jgi:hypothetical protein
VIITKVVGFLSLNPKNWFGIFLFFLQFSRDFLLHWTNEQENLDMNHYNQALNFTRSTLKRLQPLQSDPWLGEAAWLRLIPASRRRSRPGKQLGSARGSPRSDGGLSWGGRDGRRGGAPAARRSGRCGSGKLTRKAVCWATRELGRFTGGK